jgi:hypothetical protein
VVANMSAPLGPDGRGHCKPPSAFFGLGPADPQRAQLAGGRRQTRVGAMPAAKPLSPRNKGEGPRSMSPRAFGWTVRDDSVLPDASPAPSRRVTGGLRVGRPARHGAGSSSVPAHPKECVREVLLPPIGHPQGKRQTFFRPIFRMAVCSQRRPIAPQKHIRTPQTQLRSSTGTQIRGTPTQHVQRKEPGSDLVLNPGQEGMLTTLGDVHDVAVERLMVSRAGVLGHRDHWGPHVEDSQQTACA